MGKRVACLQTSREVLAGFFVAPVLPGVVELQDVMAPGEKTDIADVLLTAAENAGARDIIVAGLDVGGRSPSSGARPW